MLLHFSYIRISQLFNLLSSLDFRCNVNLVLQVQQTVAWQRVGIRLGAAEAGDLRYLLANN